MKTNLTATLLVLLSSVACTAGDLTEQALAAGFRNPPHAAKPHTWYHLMNGNVSKRGITADFEALAKAGIGGVQMFDAGCGIPAGDVDFCSEAWFDLLEHAVREARRLGLEVCIPNCSGWSSSGGPWVAPSNAMKRLVWTWTDVPAGARTFRGTLPRTTRDNGFYADIAVLGVPVPAAETMPLPAVSETRDGNTVTLALAEPATLAGFTYTLEYGWCWDAHAHLAVEISDDGTTFRPLAAKDPLLGQSGACDRGRRFFAFPRPCRAKALRIALTTPYPLNPEGLAVKLGKVAPSRTARIEDLTAKRFELRTECPATVAETDASQVVRASDVVDLTARLAPDGSLAWDAVPAGRWRILRLGFVCNGAKNGPASRCGVGLEVDKLDAKALDFHLEQYVGRLCRRLGPDLVGRDDGGFNGILIDSYEVGSQNWTAGFEKTLRASVGYDPTPFLPVFAGVIVEDIAASERFLDDFRRAIARAFTENYSKAMQAKCHAYGLKLYLEPYGNCPADNLDYGRYADVPMGEFWSREGLSLGNPPGNARYVSYLGHVWGRPFIATESFTAMPTGASGRWQKTPFEIKALGDRAFALGVNRIIYHRFVHQPWGEPGPVPGLTMGPWGMHFDRTQTWWPLVGPWLRYQARNQHVLQQGVFKADVLFFSGDECPNQGGNTDGGAKSAFCLPYGYNWDVANADALAACTAENGTLVSPGGVHYAFLAVPAGTRVLPATERTLARLSAAGVAVVPDAAAELKRRGLAPQFAVAGDERLRARVSWIQRTLPDGTPFFFVSDAAEEAETLECTFAVTGRIPEIWDAESGEIVRAADWKDDGRATRVRLALPPVGSRLVVFRARSSAPVETIETVQVGKPLTGPWHVRFVQRVTHAPDRVKEVDFAALSDWTSSDDDFIRHFSGTATYTRAHPGAGILDLGTVRDFAEVEVDGTSVAILWKPPFRCRIPAGKTLAVKVTNRWPNRLIGDAKLPEDCTWKDKSLTGIPTWVKDGKPSPTGRATFTSYRHWTADDAPLPSGLLGPVTLVLSDARE